MAPNVKINISDTTGIIVQGQVPRTLSSFFNFLEIPIAGALTLKQVLQSGLKGGGAIFMHENKPAKFYVSRELFSNPQDMFMLTIETEEKVGAAVFSLPLIPTDSVANAARVERDSELTFNEKYLPQSLIPPCRMFVPIIGSPSDISGWIKVDKKSEEWKLHTLSKVPIANAIGVGAVVDNVAVIFGASLWSVAGSPKVGRGTCIIYPSESDLPWFFFASGKITRESVQIANKLAGEVEKRIILHDPDQNQTWDLVGQKSPQPTQLPNTRFALFVPDVEDRSHAQK